MDDFVDDDENNELDTVLTGVIQGRQQNSYQAICSAG